MDISETNSQFTLISYKNALQCLTNTLIVSNYCLEISGDDGSKYPALPCICHAYSFKSCCSESFGGCAHPISTAIWFALSFQQFDHVAEVKWSHFESQSNPFIHHRYLDRYLLLTNQEAA